MQTSLPAAKRKTIMSLPTCNVKECAKYQFLEEIDEQCRSLCVQKLGTASLSVLHVTRNSTVTSRGSQADKNRTIDRITKIFFILVHHPDLRSSLTHIVFHIWKVPYKAMSRIVTTLQYKVFPRVFPGLFQLEQLI